MKSNAHALLSPNGGTKGWRSRVGTRHRTRCGRLSFSARKTRWTCLWFQRSLPSPQSIEALPRRCPRRLLDDLVQGGDHLVGRPREPDDPKRPAD
jgi:hypothetical protein